jgi:hypothetical protein
MIYIQFLWDIISKEIPNRIDLFIKYLNSKEKLDEKKRCLRPAIEVFLVKSEILLVV